ncbi:MFS domain-containing protein [Fusarium falciforme]|uniref:MFS domain-containing protein n=1 Tax=Fusarium falciforme TaxID=195108 RepID=UPI0023008081|nr:MFS domain-containing protein [Fusarium falciforme]WAO97328.1 MFS domain-containing protein [Fusarium falciforme]
MLPPPRLSVGSDELPAHVRRVLHNERELTFFGCCRCYPKAVAWSLLLFCTIVMEAYGKSLISGFIAFPEFQRRYGSPARPFAQSPEQQHYKISPAWQMDLQNAAMVCEIIGLLAHGYITYVIGYRKMMMACLLWMCGAVFPAVFATNIWLLLVSQALCGLPWGVIQTLAATYAAEVVPSTLRACVLSNINMCWLIGQLIGTGILRILVQDDSEWSYRLPFALQWAFAVPLLIGVYFAPDSPWWLIRHEKQADARHSLRRLCNRNVLDIEDTITVMEHTNMIEKKYNYGGSSYMDCFKGANLRRTEIACAVWSCQALCGSALIGSAPYFLSQAGFNPSHSFSLSTGIYGMGILGGMTSWILLSVVGRRRLYIPGLLSSVIILAICGTLSVAWSQVIGMDWALGGLIILMAFTYNLTIGPVCYVLAAEIPSTRLRVKTVALARVTYNIFSIINNALVPQMLNPTVWNLKGKACFVYTGTAFLCLIWCYFRLPETKLLSYLELDILFEKRAPTATFRELQIRLANSAYMSISAVERLRNVWHGWLAYS